MPLHTALISSLVIVSVVFTAVAFALCGAVPFKEVNPTEPLLSVSRDVIVQVVISCGAFIASPTVILTETMALSRILHRMSSDSLIPKCLSKLYRHQPVNAVLVAMTAVSLMALVFDVSTLGSLTSIGVRYACICLCIHTRPWYSCHDKFDCFLLLAYVCEEVYTYASVCRLTFDIP